MTEPNSSPIPSPKGTRDLYPDQLLRQNYITRLWRDTAVRHGFEEINGPTFEMLELYTRKSGEGIVGELFRFRREGGEDDYALRPEFTPTLARMYAARAASLPSPTKWFSIGPYFRAEKPQRGRLREFLQWNVDVLGGGSEHPDQVHIDAADVSGVLVDGLREGGLTSRDVKLKYSDRSVIQGRLVSCGVTDSDAESALRLIDSRSKLGDEQFQVQATQLGLDVKVFDRMNSMPDLASPSGSLLSKLQHRGYSRWIVADYSIVRGLAYYTGTVFEVIAEGERAIAGGGRYDNLIELFGGPPTPAVGFGMGDVVLGLLFEDKGLMPTGAELQDALSRPGASLRPEAFVVAGSEEEDALVEPLLADLRRGVERHGFDGKPWAADRYAVRPMHARRTYKATRNLKKLLTDAEKQHARYAIVLEAGTVRARDLDKREDVQGEYSVDPRSDAYIGKAIAPRLA